MTSPRLNVWSRFPVTSRKRRCVPDRHGAPSRSLTAQSTATLGSDTSTDATNCAGDPPTIATEIVSMYRPGTSETADRVHRKRSNGPIPAFVDRLSHPLVDVEAVHCAF